MTELVQIPKFDNNVDFKDFIIQNLPKRLFRIILYDLDSYKNSNNPEIKAIVNGRQFPITFETCKIIKNTNCLALAFDINTFLKACISREKIQALNKNKGQITNICQKIEDVLGNVPAVDELREVVTNYQAAINDLLNFNNNG